MEFVNFAVGLCTVIYVVSGVLCWLYVRATCKAGSSESDQGPWARWARAMIAPTGLMAVLAWYPWLHLHLGV